MILTMTGGTAQQRQWVTDAVAASSYPYSALTATVNVTWAASTPCGTAHTYMCTVDNGDGTFGITIEDWADDPANPNLKGLADPAGDVQTFYMQSFIHELGHVAHFHLVNTDLLRTTMCGLFWKPDINAGAGRRTGLLSDFSRAYTPNLAWPDCIQEAIAECIKCAFYTGRLVYMNRANWQIDAAQWAGFLALINPGGGGGSFDETWAVGGDDSLLDAVQFATLNRVTGGLVVPEGYDAPVLSCHIHTNFTF